MLSWHVARRALGVFSGAFLAILASCGSGDDPPPNPLFVSTAGADANRGDATAPLRTLSRALEIARDGYTIVVAPGEYRERVTTDRVGRAARALQILADTDGRLFPGGSPGAVTVRGAGGPNSEVIKINNSPDTLLSGFVVTGGGGGGIVVNRSDGVRIQNCVVRENRGEAGDGIRVQSSRGVLLFNNLVVRNSGAGVVLAGDEGSPAALLVNNTIALNGFVGIRIGSSQAASPGARLRANILYRNGEATTPARENFSVRTDPPSEAGLDSNFNLVFPPTYVPARVEGPNDLGVDPVFARSSPQEAADFLLRAASPARDRSPNTQIPEDLRLCLQRWSALESLAVDTGPVDLGYHLPLTAPHCGVILPPRGDG
ncbi:MAG: hypothetical protein KatS3mg076_2899 [Candidatus Binatia bacterium]|nr:MAG: hypothetical protein KatS3mg076_2899 [Candidatus Binatia bacterium]